MTAIVTYARNRIALTITRSLAQKGIRVITADNISPAMSFYSKHSSGHFLYSSPMSSPSKFIDDLILKANEYNASTIIPVHEETYIISEHKDALLQHGIGIAVSDYASIVRLNNKSESTTAAQELGIPTPKTWRPETVEEVSKCADELCYPAVIKLRKGRGSIGLQYVGDAPSLVKWFKKTVDEYHLKESNLPLIQQYITGKGIGVSMILDHGTPLATFVHERCRELPLTGGTSTERRSIRFPEAEEYSQRLLSNLKWHGVAMVEFKVDKSTHKPYFLEINPRFWGSLNQAVVSGVDFPYLLYQLSQGEKIQPITEYELGTKSIWFFGQIRTLLDCIKTPRQWGTLVSGTASLFSKDVHFDDLSLRDPLPTLTEPIFALKQLCTKGKLTFETEEELVKNVPF